MFLLLSILVWFLYFVLFFSGIVGINRLQETGYKGSSIKSVRKIFRKTNISNPLSVRIRVLEMLVFRKILSMYLMDDP